MYAKKTKWDNIPLALSNGSDPDNNEYGVKKGVNKLDADFLTGIRQRMLIILKALKFKRVFTFGRNNAKFFIPWIKPQLPDSTLFYTECDHMCQFYNPIYNPTKEAYLKLDIWLSLIASPLITYGREMMNKQGPGYEKILLIQRQAKSDGGKMGDKSKKAGGGKIGGLYKGMNKRKNQNSVPGICGGCGAEGQTNLNEAGTLWTQHKTAYFIDGKWKTYSCLGIGKKIHQYLPLSNK